MITAADTTKRVLALVANGFGYTDILNRLLKKEQHFPVSTDGDSNNF